MQQEHPPSASLWDKAAWQKQKYSELSWVLVPTASRAAREAEQAAVVHPLEQPQKAPVSETFSCGYPVFLALVDTCSCLNHFGWPFQLHHTRLSLSLSSGGLQGNGWSVVRESNLASSKHTGTTSGLKSFQLMQHPLELTKKQLCHLGLPLFSLQRSFLLNAQFVCCSEFSFLLKPHSSKRKPRHTDKTTMTLTPNQEHGSVTTIVVFPWQWHCS